MNSLLDLGKKNSLGDHGGTWSDAVLCFRKTGDLLKEFESLHGKNKFDTHYVHSVLRKIFSGQVGLLSRQRISRDLITVSGSIIIAQRDSILSYTYPNQSSGFFRSFLTPIVLRLVPNWKADSAFQVYCHSIRTLMQSITGWGSHLFFSASAGAGTAFCYDKEQSSLGLTHLIELPNELNWSPESKFQDVQFAKFSTYLKRHNNNQEKLDVLSAIFAADYIEKFSAKEDSCVEQNR